MVVSSMTPLTVGNYGTCSYTTGHPVHLVVIVHISLMYRLVVNLNITLNIINL
jgi:hypothetical protein